LLQPQQWINQYRWRQIIDRAEPFTDLANTLIPIWENMQAPTPTYLGGKYGPEVLAEVMTPEYQQQYVKDMDAYHHAELKELMRMISKYMLKASFRRTEKNSVPDIS
jgi:hypothetical protein